MYERISDIPARDLMEELLSRFSATEICQRLGIAVVTEQGLLQLADDADGRAAR